MLFDDGFSLVLYNHNVDLCGDATLYLVLFFQYEFVYLIDCVSDDGISLLFCNHNLNIGMECLSFMNQILLDLEVFYFLH